MPPTMAPSSNNSHTDQPKNDQYVNNSINDYSTNVTNIIKNGIPNLKNIRNGIKVEEGAGDCLDAQLERTTLPYDGKTNRVMFSLCVLKVMCTEALNPTLSFNDLTSLLKSYISDAMSGLRSAVPLTPRGGAGAGSAAANSPVLSPRAPPGGGGGDEFDGFSPEEKEAVLAERAASKAAYNTRRAGLTQEERNAENTAELGGGRRRAHPKKRRTHKKRLTKRRKTNHKKRA